MGALSAIGALAQLGAEYAAADAQRRQEILDAADQEYRRFKASLAGLPAALAASDAAADALLAGLPAVAHAAAPSGEG